MVLQVVVPKSRLNNIENNYSSITSANDFQSNRRRQNIESIMSQQDVYSSIELPNSTVTSIEDFESNQFEVPQFIYAMENSPEESSCPTPTPQEEKTFMFGEYLSKILSCIYAVFIVTLGLIIYISDVIADKTFRPVIFSLYLVITAFAFLTYLIIDVRIYMNKKKERSARGANQDRGDIEFHEFPEGDLHLSIPLPAPATLEKPLPHHYCLSKGRHSGSFYLKIGAAGFCLGHLVHSGLILGYQIVFLTSDGDIFKKCANYGTLILDILYPTYSFMLLYFVFKYSNVIINRRLPLARFGLMHCIASSLCFWIWTILRETLDALFAKGIDPESFDYEDKWSSTESYSGEEFQLPLMNYTNMVSGWRTFRNSSLRLFAGKCEADEGLTMIYLNYSPYLYPFTVEYNILIVGVLFVIWQYVGTCKGRTQEDASCRNTPVRDFEERREPHNGDKSNLVLYADFHSANKGLFSGIFVIVVCIVNIILFFIALNDQEIMEMGLLVTSITEIVILLVMMIAGLFAYRQIAKLDINRHQMSLLDDILIFICIPAFFLDVIFSIPPAIDSGSAINIIDTIIKIAQILVQTPLIIDGLRRCSNSKELRLEKPGRELVTFLIVSNVAMWLKQTFEVKSFGLHDDRYDYYGKLLWTVIGHMSVPLMMFYKFHSSVCLVDIWQNAYKPAMGH